MAAEEYAYAFRFEGREYRLKTFMLGEAVAVQKATGATITQFNERLRAGDAECLQALIWVARKRDDPTLRLDQVEGDLYSFQPIDTDDNNPGTGDDAEPGKDPNPNPTTAGHSATEA